METAAAAASKSEEGLQRECVNVPASTTLLNACVVFLFPLAAVEGVVRQIFSPRITAERSWCTAWLLQALIRSY